MKQELVQPIETTLVDQPKQKELSAEDEAHYSEVSKVMTEKFESLIAPARANKQLSVADNFHFKAIAKFCLITGVDVTLPKPSCKHCNGRGYTSFDVKSTAPIPCNCIYPNGMGDVSMFKSYNRDDRRKVAKASKTAPMSSTRFKQMTTEIQAMNEENQNGI